MLELRAQSDKFEGEGWAKLHAQVKPNKSLACAGKFQKHELTLIPVTGKIGEDWQPRGFQGDPCQLLQRPDFLGR